MLRIQLLGPFRVWKDEHEITAAIRAIGKADTLLKVLLSEPGRNFNRDELIECLWGEEIAARKTTEKTAAGNLRRRVSAVRKLLEPASKENPSLEYILTTADGYRWNFQADYHLDVEEFFQKYERAKALLERKQFSEAVKPYEAARQLVHGDYLENDRYAEWANPLRQRWHETNVDLLERLAECYARLGQYRHAIDSCRAVLELEAARESAYRQLMLYQYLSGNQSEALTTYETCMKLLKARGVATLDPQTKQLADQIRARHILGIDKLYTPTSEIRTEIPYTLSPGSIPFVGREKEFAELVEQLKQARRGDGCCVLVSGEAGVGKTRLVQEFTDYAIKRYKIKVLYGRARGFGEPSFWTEVIREALEEFTDDDVSRISALWLAEVAKLVPEVEERVPNLPENPSLPPLQARLRLFEDVSQFLFRLIGDQAHQQPLLLFVDDLHLADAASLEFLNYVLPRLEIQPVLIVGTYRTEEIAEAQSLAEFAREWKEKNLVHQLWLAIYNRVWISAENGSDT